MMTAVCLLRGRDGAGVCDSSVGDRGEGMNMVMEADSEGRCMGVLKDKAAIESWNSVDVRGI